MVLKNILNIITKFYIKKIFYKEHKDEKNILTLKTLFLIHEYYYFKFVLKL